MQRIKILRARYKIISAVLAGSNIKKTDLHFIQLLLDHEGLGRCFHSTDSLRIEGDGVTSTPPDSSLMVDKPNAGAALDGVLNAGSLC